jgi:hypothetical protein
MLAAGAIFFACVAKVDLPVRGDWDGWPVSAADYVRMHDKDGGLAKALRFASLSDERGCLEAMQGRR